VKVVLFLLAKLEVKAGYTRGIFCHRNINFISGYRAFEASCPTMCQFNWASTMTLKDNLVEIRLLLAAKRIITNYNLVYEVPSSLFKMPRDGILVFYNMLRYRGFKC